MNKNLTIVIVILIVFVAVSFFLRAKIGKDVSNGQSENTAKNVNISANDYLTEENGYYFNNTISWKEYINDEAKISISVPPNWHVQINRANSLLSNQAHVTAFFATPQGFDGWPNITFGISYPIKPPYRERSQELEKGLEALAAKREDYPYKEQKSSFTTIDGYKTLIKEYVSLDKQPEGTVEWCACTNQKIYIQLNDDTYVIVGANWLTEQENYRKDFEGIVNSIKFLN